MLKLTGTRPTNLGVKDGKLAPCPQKPNCVSSQATGSHAIAPLEFTGSAEAAMQKLARVVRGIERTEIIESGGDYLYVEFSSRLLGFVDDVEFYRDGGVIHVRSASRLGYSDLGVNRARIEAIREAFNKA